MLKETTFISVSRLLYNLAFCVLFWFSFHSLFRIMRDYYESKALSVCVNQMQATLSMPLLCLLLYILKHLFKKLHVYVNKSKKKSFQLNKRVKLLLIICVYIWIICLTIAMIGGMSSVSLKKHGAARESIHLITKY